MDLIEQVNDFLWGFPLLLLLMGTHIYFTVKLRFPQRNLWQAIKLSLGRTDESGHNLSPFSALSTTLAATLGTGYHRRLSFQAVFNLIHPLSACTAHK